MDERDKLYSMSSRSFSESDVSAYKRKRNKVNNLLKTAKESFHRNLLKENASDPNNFWQFVKKIYPSKSKTQISNTFTIKGISSNDKDEIAKGFASYFSKIVLDLKEKSFPFQIFIRKTIVVKVLIHWLKVMIIRSLNHETSLHPSR